MLKETKFPDDTTVILNGSVTSLQATLNALEFFFSVWINTKL